MGGLTKSANDKRLWPTSLKQVERRLADGTEAFLLYVQC
jgi:hypothetical protein